MDKLKVYIFASSQEELQSIKNQVVDFNDFDIIGSTSSEDEAMKKISFLKPSILLINFEDNAEIEQILRIIKLSRKQSPNTFIVVLIKRGMTYNMRNLYQEGADDFVYVPLDEQSLFTIERNFNRKLKTFPTSISQEKRGSKVISFVSPKGGTGKTFVAINIAIGLANLLNKRILYVDCSFPFSDVPILLDLSYSNKNIYDLVSLLEEGAKENIDDYIFHIESVNLYFLPPPKELTEVTYILSRTAEFAKSIEYVKDFFDYTILDLPPKYYDTVPELISLSDQVFAVVTSEASSIILMKQLKEELMKQGVPFNPKTIINKRNKHVLGLIGNELRSILPEGVFATVEDDPVKASMSYNKGLPVIVDRTKSKIKDDLIALTRAIAQVVENG